MSMINDVLFAANTWTTLIHASEFISLCEKGQRTLKESLKWISWLNQN